MLKKLIAFGFVGVVLAFVAYIAAAAEDEPEDHKPPKGEAATLDKAPPRAPPERAAAAGPRQEDEWGPPPGAPPGQERGMERRRAGGPNAGRLPPADFRGGPNSDRQPAPPGGMPTVPFGAGRGPSHDWASLEQRDPDLFKLLKQEIDLDRQTRNLVEDYRKVSGEKREEIKKEVAKLVEQQFGVRQLRRQLELKRLEADLQRLRDAIERRTKEAKQIIEKRVAELVGEEEDVGF
jgi:hypothetical protein